MLESATATVPETTALATIPAPAQAADLAGPGAAGRPERPRWRTTLTRPPAGTGDILRLAKPMIVASLATAGAQVALVAMLGHLGDGALYARAVYAPVLFAFLALGEAFGAATQVSAALASGRDRRAVWPGRFFAFGLVGYSGPPP